LGGDKEHVINKKVIKKKDERNAGVGGSWAHYIFFYSFVQQFEHGRVNTYVEKRAVPKFKKKLC